MSVVMGGDSRAALSTLASDRAVHVLLVTGQCWLTTTRLALALSKAGFVVSAACPPGHSLARVGFVASTHHYNVLRATRSLLSAVDKLQPQLIIPADDYAAAQIHKAYSEVSPLDPSTAKLRALIEHSLGDATRFATLYARDQISALARTIGVVSPEAVNVSGEEELLGRVDKIGFPAVLKTDGSSGGTGVAIVYNVSEAKIAYRRLAAPPPSTRAIKRLVVDGDANLILPFLQRTRARVTVQPFIHGKNYNVAIACWKGKILAQVCAEVLQSKGPTGPSTVVKIVANAEIFEAAERMVLKLGLSGFCGYDFILDASNGSAHLIDFNPRATQTCHLPSFEGRSPIVALAAKLRDVPIADEFRAPLGTPIVIFPNGFGTDINAAWSDYVYCDAPEESPELLKLGEEYSGFDKPLLLRVFERARNRWF
jgi:hypothetical protein